MCHVMPERILESIEYVHIKKNLCTSEVQPIQNKILLCPFLLWSISIKCHEAFLYCITSECSVVGHVNGLR